MFTELPVRTNKVICRCFVNTLKPRQNGRHFTDDIFKWFFVNENMWIPIKISMKFVPKGPISNIPALVQITAWRRPGDKPLSEPMVVSIYASLGLNELIQIDSHNVESFFYIKNAMWISVTECNDISCFIQRIARIWPWYTLCGLPLSSPSPIDMIPFQAFEPMVTHYFHD